jgi:hypothetical protein
MTADFELDLEERLPLFLGNCGCPDGRCHERVALALLLCRSGLLDASGLRAGLLRLTLLALGFPFLSAFEHGTPALTVQDSKRSRAFAPMSDIPISRQAVGGRAPPLTAPIQVRELIGPVILYRMIWSTTGRAGDRVNREVEVT